MTRAQILEAISAWLDQASDPRSTDKSLTIEKTGLVQSKLTGQVEQVEFTVRAMANVAQVLLPVPRVQAVGQEIIKP